MMITDDFLSTYDELREFCDTAVFQDEINPADGVTYPHICRRIPEHIEQEIYQLLTEIKGSPIVRPTLFLRLSPAGVHCPHEVHSDASMGSFSLMLYLNRQEDCIGGTSIVSHLDTGIGYNPAREDFSSIVVLDQNKRDAWMVRHMVEMRPNRAFIFDASTLHRAEPPGGFGTGQDTARLVLTCFFS